MSGVIQDIPVAGASLVVETEGVGRPLVLVHGLGDDRHAWDPICSSLSREHRLIRYDLRGFGESSEIGQEPFRHSRDLLTVLDTLQIPECDLLGVSMGASICLNLTLDCPERVRRLVLISPSLVGWEWSDEWRSDWARITEAARQDGIAAARELWWNHPIFSTTRANPVARDHLQTSISRYAGRHWLDNNEEAALPDLERLHTLAAPTLLLSGAKDLPDFRLIADLIEGSTPRVSRIDFAEAGHLLHLEYPVEVVAHVSTFLK
jgi:2-succinyl-6-hydroxy-2,4-cyclohexadiene-1-carboxylate synthase